MRFVCGLLIILFSFSIYANGVTVPLVSTEVNERDGMDYSVELQGLISTFWNLTQQLVKGEINTEKYMEELDNLYKQAESIAEQIINDLNNGNRDSIERFSAYYNSPEVRNHPEIKLIIDRFVTKDLVEYMENSKDVTPDDYFPDYGYPDPDYEYRLGEELGTEVLSVYWKKIQKKLTTGNTYMIKIQANANGELNFNGKILNIGEKETLNIDGKTMTVHECEVQVEEETKTTCTCKFQRKKCRFNLYRKKKSTSWFGWFGNDTEWELCGSTYTIIDEESGLPVVEKPNSIVDITDDEKDDEEETDDSANQHHLPPHMIH